jgi:hypothetical protein
MEHIVYAQTRDDSERLDRPNKKDAKNFFIGPEHQLTPHVIFYDYTLEKNDRYPSIFGRGAYLVACVTEFSDMLVKVHVYGIYTIKGINDILTNYPQDDIKWKIIEYPQGIYDELVTKMQTQLNKNKIIRIPTQDYEKLSDEEKKVQEILIGIKLQKIPVPSSICAVS